MPPTLPSRSSTSSLPRRTTPIAPSSQTRKHVPLWDALSCLATFRLPEHHQRAQIGTLVVSAGSPLPPTRHEHASQMGRVFVSGYIPSSRFSTPPSSQTQKCALWGTFSCLATFRLPEHHLRAQIGTLVVSAGSPPLPPARHENASRLGTCFHVWGRVFMSGYVPSTRFRLHSLPS